MTTSTPPALPPLLRVSQRFPRPRIDDPEAAVLAAVAGAGLALRPGARIALAVGSRGIGRLPELVRGAVRGLRAAGADPFVVPAMGSHGGATAEGQREMLASLGVEESTIGCRVRSSMEVVALEAALEVPVVMDRLAWEADGVVLLNRVKPHTDFHGTWESGLAKMASIGLGKAVQAAAIHRHGVRGLRELMPAVAEVVLGSGRVLLGVAVVENAYDEPMLVEAIRPGVLMERETELLEVARAHLPRLPVDELDLLIVDRIGKEISGCGMDTNVIGRTRIHGEPEPASPRIRSIVACGLTERSHGNGTGAGLADVITRSLYERIDLGVTATNVVTSGFLERGKIPVVAPDPRTAALWALHGSPPVPGEALRVARIRDTLHLSELYLSPAAAAPLRDDPSLHFEGPPASAFDEAGDLTPFGE